MLRFQARNRVGKSMAIKPEKKRWVVFKRPGLLLVTVKNEAFNHIPKMPLISGLEKSCFNLKLKTFEKYCQLKTKLSFLSQKNVGFDDCQKHNVPRSLVQSKLNEPNIFNRSSVHISKRIFTKTITSNKFRHHFVNKTCTTKLKTRIVIFKNIQRRQVSFPVISFKNPPCDTKRCKLVKSNLCQEVLNSGRNVSSNNSKSSLKIKTALSDVNIKSTECTLSKTNLKHYFVKTDVNISEGDKSTNNCMSDSSDDERRQHHPNRRLQMERPKNVVEKFIKSETLTSNEMNQLPNYNELFNQHHLNRRLQKESPQNVVRSTASLRNTVTAGDTKQPPNSNKCLNQHHPNRYVWMERPVNVVGTTASLRNTLTADDTKQPPNSNKCLNKIHSNRHVQMVRPANVVGSTANLLNTLNATDTKQSPNSNKCLNQHHPNRYVWMERPVNVVGTKAITCNTLTSIDSRQPNSETILKVADMWVDFLKTPEFWKEESFGGYKYLQGEDGNWTDSESGLDYQGMLDDFVRNELEEAIISGGETLYEKKFKEKLREPDYKYIMSQFFIPPAQVEVFYQELTDNLTVRECLKRVCQARKWPEPKYTRVHRSKDSSRFLYSCNLKNRKFTPKNPCSNKKLAKELAACQCFEWLGLKQRSFNELYLNVSANTYFN